MERGLVKEKHGSMELNSKIPERTKATCGREPETKALDSFTVNVHSRCPLL